MFNSSNHLAVEYQPETNCFVTTLPSGEAITASTQGDLELAYLNGVAPDLGKKITRTTRKYPALEDRARRAAFIVLHQDVALTPSRFSINHHGVTNSYVARVKSQNQPDEGYDVIETRGYFVCNCTDGNLQCPQYVGAPASRVARYTCEHILAYLFLHREIELLKGPICS